MNKSIMKQMGFHKEVKNVESNKCATCSETITLDSFRDSLSRKEFTISGMCQKCQDSVFNCEGE